MIAAWLGLTMAASAAPADEAQAVAFLNRQWLALAERSAAQGWRTTEGGVRWRRVKGEGMGRRPKPGDRVTAHYAGTFVDGSEFDNSYKRGEPISFPFGQVIRGWQEVMPLAAVGDLVEAAIPASLAYGPRGKGPIPGGATLLFTIEIVAVDGPLEDAR